MDKYDAIEIPDWSKILDSGQWAELLSQQSYLFIGQLRGANSITEKLGAITNFFKEYCRLIHEETTGPIGHDPILGQVYHFALSLDVADEEIYHHLWLQEGLPPTLP